MITWIKRTVNASLTNPVSSGVLAGMFAMLYFFMTMLSPILPPAMLFSTVIGYFVYKLKDVTPDTKQSSAPVKQHNSEKTSSPLKPLLGN